MSESPAHFDICQHFVPNPGERAPTEEEVAVWADLGRNTDKLVSHPHRQAILYMLSGGDALNMTVLQRVTELSSGGVAAHLRRLEEAGYVNVEKYFDERRHAKTEYTITAEGREAVARYLVRHDAAHSVDLSQDP